MSDDDWEKEDVPVVKITSRKDEDEDETLKELQAAAVPVIPKAQLEAAKKRVGLEEVRCLV